MKIAIIFDGLGFGGIERIGINYITIMGQLGYEIDVYNLTPSANEMIGELPENCEVFDYLFSRKICPEIYSYGVKRWWWGKYAYPIIYSCLSVLLWMRKAVYTQRSKKYDLAIAFSGHFNDLTFVANGFIDAKKKMCWLHGSLAEYLLIAHGYGSLYRKIKNLITLSDWMQDAAINGNKFLSNLNINKIYNPISFNDKIVDVRYTEELKFKYGDFLLMVGRFTKQKDQITIIKSLKILEDKFGISNKVLFVGDGEERQRAEDVAKNLGVLERVIFVGNRNDVQNYYSAAKLFIHSSPAEGLPTVLLEAMSFNLPIVATRSLPGVEEILCNSEYGLICPIGDPESMANCIRRMLTKEELYDYYKVQSQKRIKDFTFGKVSVQLKEILQNLD